MRRFWKEVTVEQSAYGLAIRLDGKPVKTPLRAELMVPTKSLADAVIAEWEVVEHEDAVDLAAQLERALQFLHENRADGELIDAVWEAI